MTQVIQAQFHRLHEVAVVVYVLKFFAELVFGIKLV